MIGCVLSDDNHGNAHLEDDDDDDDGRQRLNYVGENFATQKCAVFFTHTYTYLKVVVVVVVVIVVVVFMVLGSQHRRQQQ